MAEVIQLSEEQSSLIERHGIRYQESDLVLLNIPFWYEKVGEQRYRLWKVEEMNEVVLNELNDLIPKNPVQEKYAFNQAIDDAIAEVQKYNTGKELSPLVQTIISKIQALKK